jgi:hypothetical protein
MIRVLLSSLRVVCRRQSLVSGALDRETRRLSPVLRSAAPPAGCMRCMFCMYHVYLVAVLHVPSKMRPLTPGY